MENETPDLKLVDEEIKVESEAAPEAAAAPVSDEKASEDTCTCQEPCGDCEQPEKSPAAEEKKVVEVDIKALKEDLETLMDDPHAQKYAEAMVLGTQVFLWGVHCAREMDYNTAVVGAFLEAIKASMTVDGVNPRPFSAESTLENLTEFMPYFTKEVKARAEAATTTIEDVVKAVATAEGLSKEEGNPAAPAADVPEASDTVDQPEGAAPKGE